MYDRHVTDIGRFYSVGTPGTGSPARVTIQPLCEECEPGGFANQSK